MRALLRRFLPSKLRRPVSQLPIWPRFWVASYTAARNLWRVYGHARSVRIGRAVDRAGQPLPWFTYPAIEYLQQLDLSHARVFEYGSGQSTLFWAREAAEVVSVEDNETWYADIRHQLPPHCTYVFEPDLHRYVETIRRFGLFDVIIVDGPARGRTRLRCAREAVAHLRPGGLVVLDNADWLPESAAVLRDADLLQVDMSGFFPVGGHTQTTSLFFHRECRFVAKGNRQPHPSAAAERKVWEADDRQPPHGAWVYWDGQRIDDLIGRVSVERVTPHGTRQFEIAMREHRLDRTAFIYDVGRDRILAGPYVVNAALRPEDEAERLRAMSWEAFCLFIRREPTRRSVLD